MSAQPVQISPSFLGRSHARRSNSKCGRNLNQTDRALADSGQSVVTASFQICRRGDVRGRAGNAGQTDARGKVIGHAQELRQTGRGVVQTSCLQLCRIGTTWGPRLSSNSQQSSNALAISNSTVCAARPRLRPSRLGADRMSIRRFSADALDQPDAGSIIPSKNADRLMRIRRCLISHSCRDRLTRRPGRRECPPLPRPAATHKGIVRIVRTARRAAR